MRCFINKIIIILVILGSYAGSCCAEAFPVLYKVEGIVEMNDIDPYGWGGRPFALEMRIMSDAEPDYANEYGDFSRTQYIPTVSSFIVDNASQSFDDSLIEFRKIHPYHLGELNDDVRIELHDVGQNGDVLIVTKELPFCSLGQFPVSPVQSINGGGGGAVWDNSMVEHTYKLNVTLFEIHPECTIIDNEDPGFSSGPSAWKSSDYIPGGYNNSYLYAPPGDGSMWAKWNFTLPVTNNYEIFAQWTSFDNRPPAAPYTIINNGNLISSLTVDQTIAGGQFNSLGIYSLKKGEVEVVLNNAPTGYAIADAAKIAYTGGYERTLSRIGIDGPDNVREGFSGYFYFKCQAYYSDDTTALVSADNWTDTCHSADIDNYGGLRTFELDGHEQCKITASYTEGGVTKSDMKDITIIDTDVYEVIIDNEDTDFSAGPDTWKSSDYIPGGYNNSYLYAPPGDGSMWAEWEYTGESSGFFEVSARWTAYGNRSTEAPYTINIHYAAGYSSSDTVTVDQTANGGQFISLGNYSLGPGDVVTVLLSNTTTGYVIADAIKMGYRSKYWIPAQTEDNTDSEFTTGGNWGTSSVIPGYYGTNYMYATPDGGDKWAKWTFIIEEPLDYEINAQWTEFENRSPTADYSIMNNGIEIGEVTVDQTQNGGRLNNLGTFYLESGSLEVVLNKSPEGCVIADAVQIVPR